MQLQRKPGHTHKKIHTRHKVLKPHWSAVLNYLVSHLNVWLIWPFLWRPSLTGAKVLLVLVSSFKWRTAVINTSNTSSTPVFPCVLCLFFSIMVKRRKHVFLQEQYYMACHLVLKHSCFSKKCKLFRWTCFSSLWLLFQNRSSILENVDQVTGSEISQILHISNSSLQTTGE